MIKKLYKLKKLQVDQKLVEKGLLMSRVTDIEAEVLFTNNQLITTTVSRHGAISDFSVLQMHKNTMKSHIIKLQTEKSKLESEIEVVIEQIVELQKESEQFDYIIQEEKKKKFKEMIKAQDEEAAEYMQSKYIAS